MDTSTESVREPRYFTEKLLSLWVRPVSEEQRRQGGGLLKATFLHATRLDIWVGPALIAHSEHLSTEYFTSRNSSNTVVLRVLLNVSPNPNALKP